MKLKEYLATLSNPEDTLIISESISDSASDRDCFSVEFREENVHAPEVLGWTDKDAVALHNAEVRKVRLFYPDLGLVQDYTDDVNSVDKVWIEIVVEPYTARYRHLRKRK